MAHAMPSGDPTPVAVRAAAALAANSVRRAASASAVVVFVLVLAACGHGGKATVDRSELPGLVLQPKDLGPSFSQFDQGKQTRLDAHPGPREDPARFGRAEGWKARYRLIRPLAQGAAVVESRVDLFKSVAGAKKDLGAYREELDAEIPGSGTTTTLLDVPRIGDASVAAELRQGPAVFLTVAWRDANATASVVVEGTTGKTTLDDAVVLARRQERHIAGAAKS